MTNRGETGTRSGAEPDHGSEEPMAAEVTQAAEVSQAAEATSSPNPLFRAYPQLGGRIPWVHLGDWPTPVERVAAVPAGFRGELWVKRDDRSSRHYGGNKVRKLEYLLADAAAAGAGRLITTGVEGSHHCLATAVHGRRVGLPTTLVVFPQPETEHSLEMAALNRAWADEVRLCRSVAGQPFVEAAVRWRCRADRPYVIPGGGSNATGALGYVGAALELAEQVRAGVAPRPDVITVAAGTLGTLAGLAVGVAMTGLADRIVGVRIVPWTVGNRVVLGRLVEGVVRRLTGAGVRAPDPRLALDRVQLVGDYLGDGYGHPTEWGDRATEWFAERGLALDPSYTGKTVAGVLDGLAAEPDAVHLYWHTLSSVHPASSP
ncbi:MAG: pyridoxal-phosphate dependent enzyme [Longimicrobiales bacterium]